MESNTVITVPCLECQYMLELDSPELHERITCPECWADLQVVNLEPLTLAWFEYDDLDDDLGDELDDYLDDDI